LNILKPVNENLSSVTIKDIETHKHVSDKELNDDLDSLRANVFSKSPNSFYGNRFLYHFQMKNLLRCRRENAKTLYDLSDDEWEKLISDTRKRNRGGRTAAGNVYECFRVNRGSVVMFKSSTAKYMYQKYGATSVLDPTAGWGGRMLGAWACDINYTGIDTNVNMKEAYKEMKTFLEKKDSSNLLGSQSKLNMLWQSCLDVDFSKINYDFVLTSPPYINMEVYEHMTLWENNESFYRDFFLPLWEKCVTHIKKDGHVCFNVSPKMYADALSYGLKECDIEEDLSQQLGSQKKKQQDKIYIWKQ